MIYSVEYAYTVTVFLTGSPANYYRLELRHWHVEMNIKAKARAKVMQVVLIIRVQKHMLLVDLIMNLLVAFT